MSEPRLIHADCLDALREMPEASVHAIVTDPPYGLEFMGKDWDRFRGEFSDGSFKGFVLPTQSTRNIKCPDCGKWGYDHPGRKCECGGIVRAQHNAFQVFTYSWAVEALRVLTPGGHLLAFGGTRTYHRMTVALEDAGFEIRDCLMWLYGSGFPKSLDVSKAIDKAAGAERKVVGSREVWGRGVDRFSDIGEEVPVDGNAVIPVTAPATPEAQRWQGWGTALKPAYEPIVLARKPLSGTVAQTVLEHGTGAINIDGCRIGTDTVSIHNAPKGTLAGGEQGRGSVRGDDGAIAYRESRGRWPANILLDEEAAAMLDEQSGRLRPATSRTGRADHSPLPNTPRGDADPTPVAVYGDSGGASRFFYVAKASRKERNAGLEGMAIRRPDDRTKTGMGHFEEKGVQPQQNFHPTVKPVALMRYLIRLVTPPGGVVLDPFLGSGTTGVAAVAEGVGFIGIEREADYIEIARRRIAHAEQMEGQTEPSLFDLP